MHYNSSAPDARRVVAEIKALGVDAIAVKANQTKAREVRAAVGKAVKHFRDIHVLVTSAAVYRKTPFDTLTEPTGIFTSTRISRGRSCSRSKWGGT